MNPATKFDELATPILFTFSTRLLRPKIPLRKYRNFAQVAIRCTVRVTIMDEISIFGKTAIFSRFKRFRHHI